MLGQQQAYGQGYETTGAARVGEQPVKIRPLLGDGRDVTIVYDGILSRSGAQQVYLHAGYGHDWKNTYDHRMERTCHGWQCTINMEQDELRFCFKDSANNWDNNNGSNWIYHSRGINPPQ
ncbi:conserved hypothetical protein [Heliomicrobium modesticaldum Ice1]|uniref:Carbohydrate binding module family 25 domain-containing protein n=1 Tax=Heliobacterium modesticaldum (strain ATCC 51547 / Ice1) TaxID=498761 RepID=B0TCD6_HELMI|nr:carbohydrate-binding protein [Heliomicrobium modesticaldum]ABZ85324.1 conserved hypothetical protein [Heliomicrobium modesticaldum Ice1]